MSVLSLRKITAPPPSRPSSERERLAETITALREAETDHNALIAAVGWTGTATTAEHDARAALERAQGALEQARADAATSLVNAAMGSPQAPAVTVRAARAAVLEAEDDLAAAVAAKQTLRDRVGPAEKRLETLRTRVELKALDVIRTESSITMLLTEIHALATQMIDKGRVLDWLTMTAGIPRTGPAADSHTGYVSSFLSMPAMQWTAWHSPGASPSAEAWKVALEALKSDAAAILPEIK